MLQDKKYGLTQNLLATKVMPTLIPYTATPGLDLDQVYFADGNCSMLVFSAALRRGAAIDLSISISISRCFVYVIRKLISDRPIPLSMRT